MNQFESSGVSTTEIHKPSAKGFPMVFCPALTSVFGPSSDTAGSGTSAFGIQGGDVGMGFVPEYGHFPASLVPDDSSGPSVMQPGSQGELFSQLGASSEVLPL